MAALRKAKVFLLLGANLGDRLANIARATTAIASGVGIIIKKSSVYKTAPWGGVEQPDFFNQVILIETELDAVGVLKKILDIEKDLGRLREKKWESRIIDIDILFYDQQIIDSETLTIPHPALHLRRFALIPLVEIDGEFQHPVLKRNVSTLLQECLDQLEVTRL
jgi:2-amino-4-hydroxy-6-hydroxymethyldihydropteridine diphosphokinase